jgi:hypothetical protein
VLASSNIHANTGPDAGAAAAGRASAGEPTAPSAMPLPRMIAPAHRAGTLNAPENPRFTDIAIASAFPTAG